MFGLIAGIVTLIAAGIFVVNVIKMTMAWLKSKIHKAFTNKNAGKVLVADISKIANECKNKTSWDELDKMKNEGYTHVMASVNDNNTDVIDIELVKDTNTSIDKEVEQLLGREGMVVIER